MKQLRTLGIALIALFALTAVAAASASAAGEPEFKSCVKTSTNAEKKYTGGYNDKRCTEVNAAGEGKYATEEVATPLAFTGKSKTTTLYYHAGGEVLYVVTCKKDAISATIGSSRSSEEGTIKLEKCSATNSSTKATAKCATTPTISAGTGVLDRTLPAEHAGFGILGVLGPYACGPVSFGEGSALFEGEVVASSKGEFVNFTANPTTGEQGNQHFLFEGEEFESFGNSSVTEGATTQSDEVSIEGSEPIAPKKGVVVIA
jgi:hypothetical protein